MPGLLEQAQAPTEEIMVEESPGQQAMGESEAIESDVSDAAAPVLKEAVDIAYGEENFPKLVKMFTTAGAEGFPKAMGVAVSTVMNQLEGETQLPDEVLAEVGGGIFEMIAEDMIEGAKIEGVTGEILMQGMGEAIRLWSEANPGRFDTEGFAQAIQSEVESAEVEGVVDPAMGAAPGAAAAPAQGLLSEMANG